jgi:hypothetical protein
MRLTIRFIVLLVAFSSVVAAFESFPFAGTVWKVNPEKLNGPVPHCLDLNKGLLRLPTRMLTGSPTDKPVRPLPAKCALVYKFAWSSDGLTMTLTQPQLDPSYRIVSDKQ